MNAQSRTPARVSKGVPTGGQFAASAHAESDVSLASTPSTASTASTPEPTPAEAALAQRLEMYDLALRHCEDGQTVSTMAWPEEPNDDGTFDVALNVVYDADNEEVQPLGEAVSAVPAGWYTGDESAPYRTAFDAWRMNPGNPDSRIVAAKAHAWFSDYAANQAATERQRQAAAGADVEPETHAALRHRYRVQGRVTPYRDLVPGDRFLLGVTPGSEYLEVEVTRSAYDQVDAFGRPHAYLDCKRLDTGVQAPYLYSDEGRALAITAPDPVQRRDPGPSTSQA